MRLLNDIYKQVPGNDHIITLPKNDVIHYNILWFGFRLFSIYDNISCTL